MNEMAKTSWTVGTFLTLAIVIFIIVLSYIAGKKSGKKYFQKEAIVKGYAEYIQDADGRINWQWKKVVNLNGENR